MSTQILGFKLSPQQARLWLLPQDRQIDPVQCAIMIEGDLDIDRLRTAIEEITDRHEILRTTFHQRPGIKLPIQVIAAQSTPAWRTVELYTQSSEAACIESLLQEEKSSPFNYEQGPLLRVALLSFSPVRHLLVLTLPIFCADPLTLKNLFAEICDGLGHAQPGLETTQYVQFSEWQNQLLESDESEAGREYWRQRLSKRSNNECSLVPDKRSSGERELLSTNIDSALVERMEMVAAGSGATLANFLLSCWQILLWRVTGQSDVCVEVGFDGREFEELRGALGVFHRRLPIDCRCDGNAQFQESLKLLAESMTTASAAQDYYEATGDGPQLPVAFEFEEWPAKRHVGELALSFISQHSGVERYQVKLECRRRAEGVELQWHYDSAVLSSAAMERLVEQYQTLVQSAARNPEQRIAALEVVSAAERAQLIEEWNQTGVVYDGAACLHEQFEAQVERTPEAVAVVYEDAALSYAELNRRANQLAHYLREQGVGPEAVVGVLLERSLELVVSLLGVLKAGAAYLPLDPGYPEARLRYMLGDAGVQVLLTEQRLLEVVGAPECKTVCVAQEWEAIAERSAAPVASGVSGENVAYVIYTSGSTGEPKGVMITHAGLTNYLNWSTKAYSVADYAGTLVHTSIAFDLTVTSLFSPLVTGRSATILPEGIAIDGLSMALNSSDFSLIKITPAQLELLSQWLMDKDKENSISARAMVIGGEALHWSSLSFWRSRVPGIRLINEYGPTETVVGCCVYETPANAGGDGAVPIGRPIANTQLYLLSSDLQPAPAGAAGELYIGGAGVARGYLNSPAVTAEKFIPNFFSSEPGARLYKTGDLARFLPSGELEFIGRVDNQVKLRGFRIELGEIEATLKSHADVLDAVVTLREDVPGDARLVAYCVMDQQQTGTNDLQSFVKEKLPHYMIPATFVTLKSLPLTTNGKIDRQALPAPEQQAKSNSSYEKPRTEVERTIVSLWQEMLRLERVGINDNFFDLGGHSMLMVQLHSRLRGALGTDIPIVDLFGHPTISSLAEFLSQRNDAAIIFQQGQDRAGNRRTSSKRQRLARQNHRETARIPFAQEITIPPTAVGGEVEV